MTNFPAVGRRLRNELIVFVILLAFGAIAVPIAIYWTGGIVFGDYAGDGFGDFAGFLWRRLLEGSGGVMLLLLAPYLIVQCLRVAVWGLRRRPAEAASAGE